MNYSITKNGKPLDRSLYSIDEDTKTFSTEENGLVLDFNGLGGWTFKTYSNCTFNTNSYCTFNTYSDCTFNTGCNCNFKTGSHCNFKTGFACTFKTGSVCTFNTGYGCTFKTGSDCNLIAYDEKCFRFFLDESNYIFSNKKLIEIKDKNSALLNIRNENETIRKFCKDLID